MSPLSESDALFGSDRQRAVQQALSSPREAWLEPLFSPLYYVVLQALIADPEYEPHLDTHLNNFSRGRRNAEALVNYLRNGGPIPFFIPPSAMPGLWGARAQVVRGHERNTLSADIFLGG